jgi:hypothetical protein
MAKSRSPKTRSPSPSVADHHPRLTCRPSRPTSDP